MFSLERSLLAALRGPCGVRRGDRLLLAVSGGADSMALLQGLVAVRGRWDLHLEVAHFDHGLRPESGEDAAFVREHARSAGLPFHLRRAQGLADLKAGVQAAAREWRRDELRRLGIMMHAQAIATGHQRDDHLETILLKLLRGAHLANLGGMTWREDPFIRPLLGTTRADISAYLKERDLEWREDSSNSSPKYRRNRVRNELLPLMDELAGGALAGRLLRVERQSAALKAWLRGHPGPGTSPEGNSPPWLDARGLRKLPPLVREHKVYAFIKRHLAADLDAAHIEPALGLLERGGARGGAAWSVNLPGARLRHLGGRLYLERALLPQETHDHQIDDVTVTAPIGWRVTGARQAQLPAEGMWIGKVPRGARLNVRPWRPGDRFTPSWREHPVMLNDFMRDQHIERWEREQVPLVLLGQDVIAVGPGFVAREHQPQGAQGDLSPLALRIETTSP